MSFDYKAARKQCKELYEKLLSDPKFIKACENAEGMLRDAGIKDNCDHEFIRYISSEEYLDKKEAEYFLRKKCIDDFGGHDYKEYFCTRCNEYGSHEEKINGLTPIYADGPDLEFIKRLANLEHLKG